MGDTNEAFLNANVPLFPRRGEQHHARSTRDADVMRDEAAAAAATIVMTQLAIAFTIEL